MAHKMGSLLLKSMSNFGSNLHNVGIAASHSEFYHGAIRPLGLGSMIGPPMSERRSADAALDSGRANSAGLRSGAVWAALSIKEATAIASILAHMPSAPIPHSAIRVYRVQLEPFHTAPIAVMEELEKRLAAGIPAEGLVREYWDPTGRWRLKEILAPAFTVLEEVPAASERDTYVPRWVHYNEDRERAQLL
jgi:hypothetical protein